MWFHTEWSTGGLVLKEQEAKMVIKIKGFIPEDVTQLILSTGSAEPIYMKSI